MTISEVIDECKKALAIADRNDERYIDLLVTTIKAIRNAGGVAEVVSFPAEVEAIIIRNMNEEEMAYGYGNR